jgi:hypothetical protein
MSTKEKEHVLDEWAILFDATAQQANNKASHGSSKPLSSSGQRYLCKLCSARTFAETKKYMSIPYDLALKSVERLIEKKPKAECGYWKEKMTKKEF